MGSRLGPTAVQMLGSPGPEFTHRCWWGTWWVEATAGSVNFRCHCNAVRTGDHPIREAIAW